MKKKSLLFMLLFALLAPWAAQAQTRETLTFDFEDQTIPSTWTNDATYPWVVVSESQGSGHHGTYCIKSGNSGVNSSTSTISATFTFVSDGSISFLGGCWGEGSYTIYDKCIFSIDGTQQFAYGARDTWETYSFEVSAGEHTFTWSFSKDSSVAGTGDAFFVDDIVVDLGTAGAISKPTNLAVIEVTDNSAKLSWTDNASASNWQICLNDDETDLISVTENPYTLTDLTASTAYTAKVRAVVGDNTSSWSNPVSFSTTAVAVAVGDAWSDDFEGDACGWDLINGALTNVWVWGTAANNGGTHGLYISNDGGTTNAYTNSSAAMVYATKLLSFTEGKYEFTYDWIANGESTWDFLRVILVPGSVTLNAGTSLPSGLTYQAVPQGWIAVDGGSKLNLVSTWQNKSVAVNVPAGNYYLVMAWRDDTSGGSNPPAAVDNVSITRVTCAYDVEDLAVSDITTTGATLTWTAGEATQWQVAYSTNSNFEGATEEIVDAATYNMTDLTSSTLYYARVRAYCGGEDFGSWCNAISFPTACEALTEYPYNENFDSYTASTGFLPLCWNKINTTTYSSYAGYPYVASSGPNSTPNCLRFYSYAYYNSGTTTYDPQDQYAILPAMENLEGKMLTLQAKGYNANSTFKVGMMTDPADVNTFVEIGTKTLTTSYQEFIFILGEGNYVAIMMEAASEDRTTNGVYIDDINISVPPTCLKPTDCEVTVNGMSALFTWQSDAESFDVAYSQYIDDNPEEAIIGNPTTTEFDLTNFLSLGEHYVWVRANCGSDGYSEWEGPIYFHIGYCVPAPTSLDYDGILNVTFGSGEYVVNNNTHPTTSPYYGDYTGLIGAVQLEVGSSIDVTYSTHYTYNTYVWVDFNNNLAFEADEVISYGESSSSYPTTLSLNFTLSDIPEGDYRMRIGGADSGLGTNPANANPCYSGTYGIFEDYTLRVLPAPTCFMPTGLEVDNITAHTADLSWTPGNDETAWIVAYKMGDEEFVEVDATNNESFTLSDLRAESPYTVKVRANCGEGDLSEWSSEVSFTTAVACPAPTGLNVTELTPFSATLNWTGTAESYNVHYRPIGGVTTIFSDGFEEGMDNWTIIRNGGGDETTDWRQFDATLFGEESITNHTGNYVAMSRSWNSDAYSVDNWLITPQVTLNGTLSFWVMDDGEYHEHYDVYVSTTTNDIQSFELLYAPGDASAVWSEVVVDLSSFNSVEGYIALRHTDEDQDFLLIDDFSITVSGGAGEWVSVPATGNSLIIEGLNPETDYEWQVQANCEGEGLSVWSASNFFTTPSECAVPTGLDITSVMPDNVTFTWEGVQESYNLQWRTAAYADELFTEDFEDGLGNWTLVNCHSSSGLISTAHSGSSAFGFRWTTEPPQYLISPELNNIIANAELNFYYRNYSSSYQESFLVGYSTTTNDLDAFTWGDTITVPATLQWYLFEGLLLPENTKYIAIQCTSYDAYYLVIDDVVIYGEHHEAGEWLPVNSITPPFILNVNPEVLYDVHVQGVNAHCEDGVTEWTEIYTFELPLFDVFITDGNWNEGSNWYSGNVPAEGMDVIINANAIIPADYTANVSEVIVNEGASITLAEGGQLYHETPGLPVTLQKHFDAYIETQSLDNYYLVGVPFNASTAVPAAMTAPEVFDFYRFGQTYPNAEWRNNQVSAITGMAAGSGALYATSEDVDIEWTGPTWQCNASNLGISVTYEVNGNIFNGWMLVGNAFTCNGYIYFNNGTTTEPIEVMTYDENGQLITLPAGTPIAPLQAVFVKYTATGRLLFSVEAPGAKGIGNGNFIDITKEQEDNNMLPLDDSKLPPLKLRK